MTTIALTYENFRTQFKPETNHIMKRTCPANIVFAPHGDELNYVQKQPIENVWVIHMAVQYDGEKAIVTISSQHSLKKSIKPMGYIITECEASPENHYFTHFDDNDVEEDHYFGDPLEAVTISFEEWKNTYQPCENHLKDDAILNGYLFETEEENEYIRFIRDERIWTYINGDNKEKVIIQGYHKINAIGHLVTEIPYPSSENITVEFSNTWEAADDYIENYLLEGTNEDKLWLIKTCQENGEIAAATIHLLHTSHKNKYDPIAFVNEIENRSMEEVYG